jgi:hypothetical protein
MIAIEPVPGEQRLPEAEGHMRVVRVDEFARVLEMGQEDFAWHARLPLESGAERIADRAPEQRALKFLAEVGTDAHSPSAPVRVSAEASASASAPSIVGPWA